jgi:predicted ester cyclase
MGGVTVSLEENKAIVRRFFHEGLDGGDVGSLRQIFLEGAKHHFPGRTFEGLLVDTRRITTAFRTEIHELLGEGDYVVARITHFVTFRSEAEFVCQLGSFRCDGKSVQWDAIAIFRFEHGKVAEEWVNRDELSVLRQLGHVGA